MASDCSLQVRALPGAKRVLKPICCQFDELTNQQARTQYPRCILVFGSEMPGNWRYATYDEKDENHNLSHDSPPSVVLVAESNRALSRGGSLL